MSGAKKAGNGSSANVLGPFKTRVDKLLKWEKDNSELASELDIKISIAEHAEALRQVLMKSEKTSTDLVFIGKMSSGKSSTINGLLGLDVMRVDIGGTVQSTVRARTTTEPKSYFQYSNDGERHGIEFDDEGLDAFQDFIDRDNDGDARANRGIEVFVSQNLLKPNSILSGKVTILDTPGMDRDVFSSEDVKKSVLEADTLVLVVDIVSWSDSEGIRRLLSDPGFSIRPNVIVAVNKCDNLLEEKNPRRRENMKTNIKADLTKLIAFEGQTREEIDNSIFFVSAKLMSESRPLGEEELPADDRDALVDGFRKLEQAISNTIQKDRINSAIERSRGNLQRELDRIASEIDSIKGCIHQVSAHLEESTRTVKDAMDHRFVKTAFVEDLLDLDSGRAKLVSFLKHCRVYQVENIKSTMLGVPVNVRISKLIDRVLREEISKIDGLVDKDDFKPFIRALEPAEFNTSSYDVKASDIQKRIEETEARFANLCHNKREELDAMYRELSRTTETRVREINQEIGRISSNNEWYNKRKVVGYVAAIVGACSGFLLYNPSTPPFILGQLGKAAACSIAVAIFGSALGFYCARKYNSGQEELRKLKRRSEDIPGYQAESRSKQAKLNDYNAEQESKKTLKIAELNLELQKNKRLQIEEELRMKAEYKKKHESVLTDVLVSVIRHVSKAVQMKLDSTTAYLDQLQNDDTENKGPNKDSISDEWQWVSDN